MHGEPGVRRDAARILPVAVREALIWFNTFDAANLLPRVEEHRLAERPGGRFTFDNWIQQPLARAFVLAHAGKTKEACAALARWVEASEVSGPVATKLRALLAAGTPGSTPAR